MSSFVSLYMYIQPLVGHLPNLLISRCGYPTGQSAGAERGQFYVVWKSVPSRRHGEEQHDI